MGGVPGTCPQPLHLDELLLLQVPLLDAVVPGATEKDISLDGQTLDAIVVRRLEVVGGANGAAHTLTQLEHLVVRRETGGLASVALLPLGTDPQPRRAAADPTGRGLPRAFGRGNNRAGDLKRFINERCQLTTQHRGLRSSAQGRSPLCNTFAYEDMNFTVCSVTRPPSMTPELPLHWLQRAWEADPASVAGTFAVLISHLLFPQWHCILLVDFPEFSGIF